MNKLKTLFLSIIIGLSAAIIAVFAFTGPGSNQPPAGDPTFWRLSGTTLYYDGGVVKIGSYASKPSCSSAITGGFVFDTTNSKPYVCNGTTWKSLDTDFDSDGIIDWNDWDDTDAAKKNVNLTVGNIKSGIDIFGVTGSYTYVWTTGGGGVACSTRCANIGRAAVTFQERLVCGAPGAEANRGIGNEEGNCKSVGCGYNPGCDTYNCLCL